MSIVSALRRETPIILPLFLPILISQYAGIANGVIDTAMAGALGTVELASIAVGAAIWVPFFAFILGTLYGLLIFVSQAFGAGDSESVNASTQQGMYLGVALGLLTTLILYLIASNISLFGVEAEIAEPASRYIKAVIWSIPVACMVFAVRFYCEGQKAVMPVTIIAVISVGFKILFNYMFMFGNFGMPAMGVAGCGLATICEYTAFLLMLVGYVSLAPRFSKQRLFGRLHHPNFSSILEITKKGVPIGLCFTSEFLIFSVMVMFISQEGAVAAAAHQIAFNCMILFFSMAAAFSSAACIRVGNLFGGGDKEKLRHAVSGIVSLSALIGCLLMAGMIFKAQELASLFTSDALVIPLAVSILYVAAFFQIADSMQVCLNGVLRGVGDVSVPFLYTTIAYWGIGIPLGYVLAGMPLPLGLAIPMNFGVVGWWLALTVALFIATAALGWRMRVMLWGKAGPVENLVAAQSNA
ncbi:MATE family efflux transporter [Pseudodesulfovibrio alkaliphilus]|nr:MATE family efflux transporter [Pseudodesulfovibrio alkaliphilus]